MTQQTRTHEADGPDGSIFLFKPLSDKDVDDEYFEMLTARGRYRNMAPQEIGNRYEDLLFRQAISQRLGRLSVTASQVL